MLRDRHAAEDAAQEALVRAWRSQATCRSVEGFPHWLRAIAGNEARRLARRRSELQSREDPDPEAGIGSPASDEPLDALACDQLLALLPPDERGLLRLRYLADLSQPQIARRLELPEGTVKVRLHRSRQKLRTLLTNEGLG